MPLTFLFLMAFCLFCVSEYYRFDQIQMSQLSASEERFRALVTATSDVVYRMSPDWSVMHELDGRGFLESTTVPITGWREKNVHPADLDIVNEAIDRAIATKGIFELEHRVVRTDGSTGWTVSRAVPILDADGEIIEWFGAASDVSLRKQAEADLKLAKEEAEQQKRLYETVTSSTPDLIYVFGLDYRFTYANQALLSMWGKSWKESVGKRLLENGYEPWHAEMHEREIDQVVATGKPIRGEVSFPHASLGNRIYDYILTPVFNEQGIVEAVAGTTRDVTERKQQEVENLNLTEEMAAINEELGASNEELNATNEELLLSQEMLSQANSDLQQILNMLPASVVVIRGDELVVEMINNSNLEYWQKTKEEVVGRPFLEILPDLADQPFAGQLRKVMETGIVLDVKESPVLFTDQDGNTRETYVDYTYQPLSDLEGNRNGVLVMSFEITDRVLSKRMLEKYAHELSLINNELAKSESRFKFLIREAPVAIGVLNGRDLIIESANSKLLEVWGKSSTVIGLTLSDALPELREQPFLRILDEVYTSGEAFYANEIRAMLEHKGLLREFFFNVVYQPVADASGATADILVVAVDVTEQVNSRKKVEQAETILRHAIEAANVGTWQIHSATRELISSPRLKELFGYYADDEMGLDHAVEQIHEEYRQEVTTAIENAITKGGKYDVSYKVIGYRDKKVRWLRALGNSTADLSGKFSTFTGVVMDITDIKQDELRKNDFIGMVSHELKTPLTSLNGYLQFLQRKVEKGNAMEAPAFDQPLKQVRQMTAMINGFLNVSRLDSGKIHIEKTRFDMADLIKESQEEHLELYASHKIILRSVPEVYVDADRAKVAQVINNLVSNAVKYSTNGTIIQISCEVAGDVLRVGVSDHGIGIREQDVSRLFERYYRVENNSNVSGFGIGLYLSAEIIERHGGKIWAESEIGKGSIFYFELPL